MGCVLYGPNAPDLILCSGSSPQKNIGFLRLCLALSPVRLVSGGLRAMEAPWIPALSCGSAPLLYVSLNFVRVCILLRR